MKNNKNYVFRRIISVSVTGIILLYACGCAPKQEPSPSNVVEKAVSNTKAVTVKIQHIKTLTGISKSKGLPSGWISGSEALALQAQNKLNFEDVSNGWMKSGEETKLTFPEREKSIRVREVSVRLNSDSDGKLSVILCAKSSPTDTMGSIIISPTDQVIALVENGIPTIFVTLKALDNKELEKMEKTSAT